MTKRTTRKPASKIKTASTRKRVSKPRKVKPTLLRIGQLVGPAPALGDGCRIPELDVKMRDGFPKAVVNTFWNKPDFEPANVEYPADWWEAFKARWFPWTTPRIVKLSLYRRAAVYHTPSSFIGVAGGSMVPVFPPGHPERERSLKAINEVIKSSGSTGSVGVPVEKEIKY